MFEPIPYAPIAWCTIVLMVATGTVSWLAFQHRWIEERYIFQPEAILAGKEYYRLVTSAFLHAGWGHLILNMVTLYAFGRWLEWGLGRFDFLLVYFGSVVGGSLLSLFIHRHHDYLAYGASGGVCGIVFAYILLFPGGGIYMYFAVPIPGWLYAIAFLVGSWIALRRARDNIGHDAHLGGAIVGLLIAAALRPEAVRQNWLVFLIVLGAAAALLGYLWINPHLLPVSPFAGLPFRVSRRSQPRPTRRSAEPNLDAILEKIARSGVSSLTTAERTALERASAKLRRQADSKKPGSDLTI
jgi:membrane associated rhomboid family serine protease